MTTIAIDSHGVHIAADGLINASGSRITHNARKIRVDSGAIYALAGTTCLFEPLIKWHKAGADPANVPAGLDSEWALLVVTKDGAVLFSRDVPYPEQQYYPWTQGTGYRYAMGALKAGASAQRAVEIACEIDIHSGGEIQVVNIAQALGMAPQLVKTG